LFQTEDKMTHFSKVCLKGVIIKNTNQKLNLLL